MISNISKDNAKNIGKQAMLWQTQEECGELVKAIAKYNRANGFGQVTDVKSEDAYIDMLKEIADVSICIEQLIYLLNADDPVKRYRIEAFEKVRKRYCDTK